MVRCLVSLIFKFCNCLAAEEIAGCFTLTCVLAVMWLAVFCVSSSQCRGLVCALTVFVAFSGHTHMPKLA